MNMLVMYRIALLSLAITAAFLLATFILAVRRRDRTTAVYVFIILILCLYCVVFLFSQIEYNMVESFFRELAEADVWKTHLQG